MSSIKRALLSVSDKNGLVDLAKGLASRGIELIAQAGQHVRLQAQDVL